ncbi:TetR/AcrR family transcriptional regulator [Streptomyces deccanensis]|uniref:TetR/AcrR family transcriptional regulator n=1 Tax=Streptomyces deccanensis TaxID=424188 RepID=UPI001EFA8A87|nr:TetR/AcrR family transcriptional regulator [Streptomyces deccanensis]ULR51715.1 TetR/AcrR family transcriptional regulator [Streptomyces deccanensis]
MSASTSSEDRPRKRRPYAPRVPLAERREQLLDAALAVIVSDGYDRISIDAVAKRAGVARSVVYGAYENLDALLTALLDRQQARAFARLLATVPRTEEGPRDPAAFASEAVRRMSAMLREDPDTWRLILLPPGNMPTVVRDRIEADRERFRTLVEEWLALALADRPGPALDPRLLAHALVACAEHFGRVALTDPGRFDPDHLIDQVRTILGALWPPPP